jgi:hypothetical protein
MYSGASVLRRKGGEASRRRAREQTRDRFEITEHDKPDGCHEGGIAMNTRVRILLLSLILSALVHLCASAQTTIDQRLIVTRNDGVTGGVFTIALQVKATNLTGRNTLGTATIDIHYAAQTLAYVGYTFPNLPSGISLASGYMKSVSPAANIVRFGTIPAGVDGVNAAGTDLTTAYVTWGTVSFAILNPSATASFTIDPATNQIGLFAQEGNSDGAGKSGNGVILDQTLSTPIVVTDAALPVELVTFKATTDRLGTRLEWNTATETNNAGFDIERADASCAPPARRWTTLGFVAGSGTCSAERSYSFTVGNASDGNYLYRLKQIDQDGRARYSQEIEAPRVVPHEFALMQNYPNPFNPSTSIGFALPEDSHVSIIAYDMLGRKAAIVLNEALPAGFHTVAFDAAALSSGVYIYRMTARCSRTVFTAAKRLVLMH